MNLDEARRDYFRFINDTSKNPVLKYREKTRNMYLQSSKGWAKFARGEAKNLSAPKFDEDLYNAWNMARNEKGKRYSMLKAAADREEKKIIRSADYDNYLLTDAWKIKCKLKHERAGYICELCGVQPSREVHHLTYERLGDEWLIDLVAVCKICHGKYHWDKKWRE